MKDFRKAILSGGAVLAVLLASAFAQASVTVTVNGTNHTIPQTNERGWGNSVTAWIQAISQYSLQPSGGSFVLTNDVNFGPNYGLKSKYFQTREANPAASGVLRLANTDKIAFRSANNSTDVLLGVDANNKLTFDGFAVPTYLSSEFIDSGFALAAAGDSSKKLKFSAGSIATGTTRTLTMPDSDVNLGALTNSNISPAAAIAKSKLDLAGQIADADIAASAAISPAKLQPLTGNRAVVTGSSGAITASAATDTEVGYLSGVTSSVQTQINGKLNSNTMTTKGDLITRTTSGPTRLAVGADGYVLTADAAQSEGIKWAPSTASAGVELISNPGWEFTSGGWTASGGTYARTTTAANVGLGIGAGAWDSNASGQTLCSDAATLPQILYGENGAASIRIQTPSGTATHQLVFKAGGTVRSASDVVSSTGFAESEVTWVYPTASEIAVTPALATVQLCLQSVAANEPQIYLDQATLGLNSRVGKIAQAEIVVSASRVTSDQSVASTAATVVAFNSASRDLYGEFNQTTGVYTAKSTRSLVIDTSVYLKGLTSAEAYSVSVYKNGVITICRPYYQPADTNTELGGVGPAGCQIDVIKDDTVDVRVKSTADASYSVAFGNSTYLTIRSYPTVSQSVVKADLSNWYVDATLGGGNPSLGIAAVTSYTSISDSALTMTPNPGSAAVGAVCSGTNPAATPSNGATTCAAGSEVVGFNANIPRAGTYEVCGYYTWEGASSSGSGLVSIFQWGETATNSQTIIQNGRTRVMARALGITAAMPFTNCTIMDFATAGTKALRLFYTQSSGGTPSSSLIVADQIASFGGRDMRFTMRPWQTNSPSNLVVGSYSSANTGAQVIESATLVCDTTSSVSNASSSWITLGNASGGSCAMTFTGFSGTPKCFVQAQSTPTTNLVNSKVNSVTQTGGNYLCTTITNGSSTVAALTPCTSTIVCIGQK